jgi:hypothetical protein
MGAAFATRVAIELANAEPFPASRRSEDAAREELARSGQSRFLEHHWGYVNRVLD